MALLDSGADSGSNQKGEVVMNNVKPIKDPDKLREIREADTEAARGNGVAA